MSGEEARPPSSRGRLLLAVVVVAALVAFLWPRERPEAPSPPTVAPPIPVAVAPPAPAPPPKPAVETPKAESPAKPAEPATTGAIVGTALRLDGVPAAGARVLAGPGQEWGKGVPVDAGPDGTFRFDSLAPGKWSLVCAGNGYGTRVDLGARPVEVEVTAGSEARVEVRGQALATVAGRVLDTEGKPVPKAKFRVQCDAFLFAEHSVWVLDRESGEDGAFEMKSVTPCRYVVISFSAPGLGTEQREFRNLEAGSRTVVDVVLDRAVTLDLVITAEDDGSPVRNAIVWIADVENGRLYETNGVDNYTSDAEGRVHAESLRPKPVKIQMTAEGFVGVPDTVVDPVGRTEPYAFRMKRSLRISGRVLRADGSPAHGVRVVAGPEKRTDPMTSFHSMMENSDETDDAGAFRIEGLTAGRYTVGVVDGSLDYLVSTVAEVGSSDILLTLPASHAAGKLTVRAVDAEGRPVPKALYRSGLMADGLLCKSSGGGSHQEDWNVEIEPPMTAFVEIWDARDEAGRRLPLGHRFVVVPPDARKEWTVTLPPERTVEGRVVGPGGKPAEGATIRLVTVPGEGLSEHLGQELVGTVSGAGGVFRVDGLGEDRVRLCATADGFVGRSVEAGAGAREVVLTLEAEVVCELRVLDPAGKPVEHAWLAAHPGLEDADFDPPTTTTDAAGRARLRGLAPGTSYVLFVNPPDSRKDLLSIRRENWTPGPGEIRFERTVLLEGVVRIDGRAPPSGWMGLVEARRDGDSHGIAEVEEGGRFTFQALPEGRYELRVMALPEGKVLATVEATAGGPAVTIDVKADAGK